MDFGTHLLYIQLNSYFISFYNSNYISFEIPGTILTKLQILGTENVIQTFAQVQFDFDH